MTPQPKLIQNIPAAIADLRKEAKAVFKETFDLNDFDTDDVLDLQFLVQAFQHQLAWSYDQLFSVCHDASGCTRQQFNKVILPKKGD